MAQIAFTGRLTRDAEIKYTTNGKAIATLNIAENHSRLNKNTNQFEDTGTTWRRVTLFGKRAEALTNLQKGTVLTIQGREETREYDKQDGTKGSSLEVIADIIGIVPTNNTPQTTPQPTNQQQGGWGNQPNNNTWGNPQGNAWGNDDTPPF